MSSKILNVEHVDEEMDTEAEDDYDDNDITDVDGEIDSDTSRARSTANDKPRKLGKSVCGSDNSPLNALVQLANKSFDDMNGDKNGKLKRFESWLLRHNQSACQVWFHSQIRNEFVKAKNTHL